MSAYHEIFVRTDRSEATFVADVGFAAGCPVAPTGQPESGITYRGVTGRSVVEIEMTHEFEGGPDTPLADYPALITVRDLDNNKSREEEKARDMFARLSDLRRYSMLLVFDLQKKLMQI